MSRFDEEPDGDIHGECEAEIQSLKYQLTNYRIAHERQAATITRLEAAEADPSRVRHVNCAVHAVRFAGDVVCFRFDEATWGAHGPNQHHLLRLTAPAPKRVEVRAALWSGGRITFHPQTEDVFITAGGSGFVRWLTNWHIEGGKVFVEME